MRSKKRRKQSETPELRFRRKLIEEYGKNPGMTVRAERMAQGRMADYRIRYIHASNLDPGQLERNLKALWGGGPCFLRFVDETREPLDEYGSLWIDLGNYDDLDDRLEKAQFAANMATLKIMMEMEQSKRDAEMDSLTVLAGLAGNIRRNRINSGMIDALKRSMQRERPDSAESIHATIGLMREAQDQEHQRIMKQQADAVKQLQTALAPIVAEMQATLQAQELECETAAEPVSQEHQWPIVGLKLQRLETRDILQGLGKPQNEKEGDQ